LKGTTKSKMTSLYRQQLERWLKSINVKAESVLDVGGGQNPVIKRVNGWRVKEYKILDNNDQFKPDYFVDLNDQGYDPDWGDLDGWPKKESFDVVFCLEVFEYIWQPFFAHQNIFNFLKPKGIAYISYPTIYPLHNPPKIDYLRYTKNAVEKFLAESGFKKWEITPRIASEGLDSLADFYSYERMRAMKETKEIFDIGYLVKCFK